MYTRTMHGLIVYGYDLYDIWHIYSIILCAYRARDIFWRRLRMLLCASSPLEICYLTIYSVCINLGRRYTCHMEYVYCTQYAYIYRVIHQTWSPTLFPLILNLFKLLWFFKYTRRPYFLIFGITYSI